MQPSSSAAEGLQELRLRLQLLLRSCRLHEGAELGCETVCLLEAELGERVVHLRQCDEGAGFERGWAALPWLYPPPPVPAPLYPHQYP